jgi:hypothetical protein
MRLTFQQGSRKSFTYAKATFAYFSRSRNSLQSRPRTVIVQLRAGRTACPDRAHHFITELYDNTSGEKEHMRQLGERGDPTHLRQTAANLTERGFKWFFRTTPINVDIARIYMEFVKDMKAKGMKIDSIAIVHENTEYGTSTASAVINSGGARCRWCHHRCVARRWRRDTHAR